MKTRLDPYTFNSKKWRIKHGYTTPEWQMYVDNSIFYGICFSTISFLLGVVLSVIAMS